jgi:hypothetical protein
MASPLECFLIDRLRNDHADLLGSHLAYKAGHRHIEVASYIFLKTSPSVSDHKTEFQTRSGTERTQARKQTITQFIDNP